jgi:hypothetical protein
MGRKIFAYLINEYLTECSYRKVEKRMIKVYIEIVYRNKFRMCIHIFGRGENI